MQLAVNGQVMNIMGHVELRQLVRDAAAYAERRADADHRADDAAGNLW